MIVVPGKNLIRLAIPADLFGKRRRDHRYRSLEPRCRLWRALWSRSRDRRGIAALEFALAAPVLLAVLAPLADFTLALSDRMQLAAAVEAGADYAFNQGQVLAGTQQSVSATDVQAKVLTGTNLTATASVTGPATYCVSSDNTLTTGTAGQSCPGTTDPPGTYMIITASYNYTPMLPLYSMMAATTLTETASVRLY